MGFNVHANVAVDGRDRERLERLCRYLGRPPIAQERLSLRADGRVQYLMKKPWRDGTRALVFEPLDLIARLCAMVPPPGVHRIRFHGVLAGHAADRAEVVPVPPEASNDTATAAAPQLALFPAPEEKAGAPRRRPWAWLLKHVFAVDVTVCPRCAGPMRWRDVATSQEDIARLLARHPNEARAPPATRRRAPRGQLALDFGVAV